MTMDPKPLARRQFLRFALAAAAVAPLGGALASCAAGGGGTPSGGSSSPAGAVSADNPFGVADSQQLDAVIFNGGYGIDYVEFAAARCSRCTPA